MSPREIFSEIDKYRNYIKSGGVTVSGGEPLLQAKELKELFEICRNEGIHTAIDTTGVVLNNDVKELLKFTDLVLLDIKSIEPNQHLTITGGTKLERAIQFLDYLQESGTRCWIRHVVLPGYTDDEALLRKLANSLEKYSVIDKVELLAYHNLAEHKYENLGLEYPLKDTEPLSRSRLDELKPIFSKWQ